MRADYYGGGRAGTTVRRGSEQILKAADGIAFDCDGVLVDARGSYDVAITLTAQRLVEELTGMDADLSSMLVPGIYKLRGTGYFNNDWDTVYVLVVSALAGFNAERGNARAIARAKAIINGIVDQGPQGGIKSVDAFLLSSGIPGEMLRKWRSQLGYPGRPPASTLASMFDEAFYGGAVYRGLYGADPRFGMGRGLIGKDRTLVSERDLDRLCDSVGRRAMSIITGRPRRAVEISLGPLMGYFSVDASVFIGDAELGGEGRSSLARFRKPSHLGLTHARKRLGAKTLLYVGDSAEDAVMVSNARRMREKVAFVGVFKTALDRKEQIAMFEALGADMIVPGVTDLPDALRGVRA